MAEQASSICVRFSGLVFRFRFPQALEIPEAFAALRCEDPGYADEQIELRLLHQPLAPAGDPIRIPGYEIYTLPQGRLCIYPSLVAADGCQVAFLCCPDRKNILYYPASRWDFYSHPLNCRHLIRGEMLLLRHGAFLLHSSVVKYRDQVLLFCGPSGIGKSTQASLWHDTLGADILNGDRCLIQKKNGQFWGGGSLWCGTSKIYRSEYAPITAVILLGQSSKNRILPAGRQAFPQLFRQCTLNSWDPDFMAGLSDLLVELIERIPIFRLNCQPNRDAVLLARDKIFLQEESPW